MSKANKKIKEKRASQRVYYCMPVKYKVGRKRAISNAIACQDIGGGGLRLLITEPVKVKDKLFVSLYPIGAKNSISAECKVVWSAQCKDGNYNTGLEFIEIKDKEYFIEFLCEKILDFSLNKIKF